MKAEERTISNILTEKICYEIPPYQRSYSWTTENVEEILQDIWDAYDVKDSKVKEYFIGSIITIEKERDCKYEVVDGQQRLTTLNLIFARLSDRIANPNVKADLSNRILLRNPYKNVPPTPRLTLRKSDQKFFYDYVLVGKPFIDEKQELNVPQKNIIENMETIDEFFKCKNEQELISFADYILFNVYIVFVNTNSLQSAYQLFNVLNARGKSLSNSDLIKNTLFRQLEAQAIQSKELELDERWQELEKELGIDQLDQFFSHFRTSITAVKARAALYLEIEAIISKPGNLPFDFLDNAIKSAENYTRINQCDFSDAVTRRALRSLQKVKYDDWISPLLTFLNQPIADFPESTFFVLLEKITMQNWVRRLGRTKRLTVYHQLIKAIIDRKKPDEVQKIFQHDVDNEEFFNFLSKDLYGEPFAEAVLFRLEEAEQDESVTKSYSGQITIEHILPQKLDDPYWKTRFSDDQHKLWLHRLGNLTLLSGHKNRRGQYFDFDRKKKIYLEHGKKVSFDLTKEVCGQSEWTTSTIEARHNQLMDLAKKIWTIEIN